ncbi:ATP-binding protein [Frigidibacter sp.]|uniref:ATP-binding protein n=1 Tax=Frigidibacter sp. TaxID=2586418 RepID=UPI00273572EC|nr:ATP-binding protein [Frigidibacter sp.]MDP3339228.1 ATP-binding protein [Frigidibacter sp.]
MTSLRARIAILLIVAICSVVGLATLAASRALQRPAPEATMEPLARHLHLLADVAVADPVAAQAAGLRIEDTPATGTGNDRLTRSLSGISKQMGHDMPIYVTNTGDGLPLTVSLGLGDTGWLIAEIPNLTPPRSAWLIFFIWMSMIVLGSVVVALHAARRLTIPLELLESAAERIGTDGILSEVPETGTVEVRATARALNRLSQQLGTAVESRMRLVAAAGHDLRTPMTRMRLRAEFIEDDEERGKWLSDIEELDQIADSAIRLVREEVSRDGADVLRLDVMVEEIAEELGEFGHPVRCGDLAPLSVRAGPLALRRALRNVMINAATHGGGADITLSKDKGQAVVTIRDTGPGIPEAVIGQVFEPFFRVDLGRRKTLPGAGLGLAIACEIVERYGGTLTLRNAEPHGLIQQLVLPIASADEGEG